MLFELVWYLVWNSLTLRIRVFVLPCICVKFVNFTVASLLILIYVCEHCVEVRIGKKGLL
jgi:hypothetical protein